MKKSRWFEFLNDFGDTTGGILVGVGFCTQHLITLIIGTTMIITSIFIEYYNKGKKDSN